MLKAINQRWRRMKRRTKALVILATVLLLAAVGVYLWIYGDLPSIDRLQAGLALPSTRIYDRNGRLLYEVIDPQGGRNLPIALDQVPNALIQATVATEDRNFYSTPGVDLEGMVRALWINLQGGEIRAGGSTITQQVARNLLLDPSQRAERTLQRKLREMVLAIQLQQRYDKNAILAMYLNQTYYGNLAYGVQAAAQVYFNKNVRDLTLAEASLLAGLPQSPALYDPLTNPSAAKARQKVVLGLMVDAGYITKDQAEQTGREPLQYGNGKFQMNAPHFVQEVWKVIEQKYGDEVYRGGLDVTTTLDLDWQNAAEDIARRHLAEINNPSDGSPSRNANGAALVAIDPATGQILAMLGSTNYFDNQRDGAVNMAVAPRQPGSTLKPFTYALTFDPAQEDPWSPSTMVLDVTTPFITRRLQSYTPSNYGQVEHGPVSVREALASSYNIPAVIALDKVGVNALVNELHKLGVTTLQNPERIDLSITLGGGEVSLKELTAAYAAFPNGGRPIETSMILSVKNKEGKSLYQWTPPPIQDVVIDPQVAWLITSILSDNDARRPAFGINSPLSIGRFAAVKTGTTTDFRDNWTVGYTPQVVVGVWVGNPDNTPMRDATGVTGAAPIWNEFIRTVLKDKPDETIPRPAGLVQAEICALSGKLPTQLCQKTRVDWFIQGTIPTDYDKMYQEFIIDRRTGLLASDSTPAAEKVRRIYIVLPQEARLWGMTHGIEPAPVPLDQLVSRTGEVRILSPDPFTVFQITPVLPIEAQKVRFSTLVPTGARKVDYLLNNTLIESVDAEPWWMWWQLAPGNYTLQARVTLNDGTTRDSAPITFSVVKYVAPADRPPSGEVK